MSRTKTDRMRLGFYYHAPAIRKDDGIYMPGPQGRFIEGLAEQCERVICLLHEPYPHESGFMDYKISAENVDLVNLGVRSSAVLRTIRPGPYTTLLLDSAAKMDMLLVRGPSPLLPAIVTAAPVPTALLLVGDYVSGVDDLPQPRWRKEAIRLWSYWNKWEQQRSARKSLTFVNSRILFDELRGAVPHLHEVRTTTLTRGDFYVRSDTCQGTPHRLLYVGRMDRSKGLLQMVEAVALLTRQGECVMLDLVGWPERGDPVLDQVRGAALREGVADKIHYLGPRTLGHDLLDCYRRADVFVIASLGSEGFPRVIWEAMANSLPVVATRVGSIPALIEGAAELVEPRSSAQLAAGIRRILHDGSKRQELIRHGRELAQGNTVEDVAAEMVDAMRLYLAQTPKEDATPPQN